MRIPAKINLYLQITGKRSDGYHNLDSLMVNVDVCDEIEVVEANDISLKINGEFCNSTDCNDNIVIKAAKILADNAGIENFGAKISLQKNIPVGAGLGGGSADAAAALKLLNKLWDINYPTEKLMQLGLKLGADVPFFFAGSASYVSGIGDKVNKIDDFPRFNILLVNPNKTLLTKEVFTYAPIKESGFADKNDDILSVIKNAKNDLQKNSCAIVPEISDVLNVISEQKGCFLARMSGSGATCFGLFNSAEDLTAAEASISQAYNGWWVKHTYSLA